MSQLRERARALEEARKQDLGNYNDLKAQYDKRREELDTARDDVSRLSERAGRVQGLEESLAKAGEDLRIQAEELRQVSAEASQKAALALSNAQQAEALDKDLAEVRSQLRQATDSLYTVTAQKATLEEQVSRIKPLQDDLAAQEQALKRAQDDLGASNERRAALEEQNGRIKPLEDSLAAANQRIKELGDQLNTVTERKATLEEQVSRIKPLEDELAGVRKSLQDTADLLTSLKEASGAETSTLRAELAADRDSLATVRGELASEKQARADAEGAVNRLTAEVTQLSTQLQAELKASQEKLALLDDAKNTLSEQFKNVANDLLEEKSRRFAEQNQANLGQLLDPLRLQINEFKGKVEEVYVQESKDRSAMAEQVRQLVALNQVVSQEAKNLTNALKGNTKAQGNWGELVLERVLEASGLRKGEEYIVQDSQVREDGSRAQPDVVIMLPEQRKLVIDSKVSLIAYEEYTVTESDDIRALAARKHLDSVRKHVQGLSSKEYEKLYGGGLDFVLMFIPIEPAFMLAISHDDRLFMDAWGRNVLLVSPSTLLFVVRTVAHLWRQEAQSKNAQDIAKRGAELYDKLVDFVKDLEQVGTRLKQAQDSYADAHKRLSTGKGNVIRQAEMLRNLGVKVTKKLPHPLVDEARSELSAVEELARIATSNTPAELPASSTPWEGGQGGAPQPS
ncbi:DNA recombination protein RmuC [Ramlibacter sp. 2FC]|uniref:DNA recombination protein RmuC n=1 Tax=Ramlibacter sp. 2FC TaxID=2502188 RepID=UPI00201D5FFB|nr:DNA recombination protein RmuC [Ramlibacter sp. 2FC]